LPLRHIENCAKIMLATGMIVSYAYGTEFWTAWYSGSHWERFAFWNRAFGWYGWSFWVMVFCNAIAPQILWIKKARTNLFVVFVVAFFANIGMWFERFVIIVTSLSRDFLPSSWRLFILTCVALDMVAGTSGLFFALLVVLCRF